jgi:hypothetical protein
MSPPLVELGNSINRKKEKNYQFLALCVYQLTEAGRGAGLVCLEGIVLYLCYPVHFLRVEVKFILFTKSKWPYASP